MRLQRLIVAFSSISGNSILSPLWYNSSVDFQKVPAIVSVFFILAQETLRDFIEKIEYVFILWVFLKPFITSF
ncbi:MAG: hypothetical protein E6455_00650 [Streptococcus salivarius]|nr:hypothetical protein [Streptococcus salivarius]MDU6700198.1 hypothetical protein [Streptococcus salivarius]